MFIAAIRSRKTRVTLIIAGDRSTASRYLILCKGVSEVNYNATGETSGVAGVIDATGTSISPGSDGRRKKIGDVGDKTINF